MPKRKKGPKFYAVAIGRNTGIFSTWAECQTQVMGFSNAKFKSFSNVEEAKSFIASAPTLTTRRASTADDTEKILDSITPKQKRPRKVVSKTSKGSASNPIKIESSLHLAAKSAATPPDGGAANGSNSSKENGNEGGQEDHGTPQKIMFHIMFDGGSRGNPHGDAGSGTYILTRKFYSSDVSAQQAKQSAKTKITRDTTKIRSYLGLGKLTNNQAEYTGLVTGLEQVLKTLEKTRASSDLEVLKDVILHVQGDSDLIVKQMNGIYACKSPKLKSYYQRSKELVRSIQQRCKNMGVAFGVTFEHVYREDNKIADGLANEAMDAKRSWTTTKGDADQSNNTTDDNKNSATDDAIEV